MSQAIDVTVDATAEETKSGVTFRCQKDSNGLINLREYPDCLKDFEHGYHAPLSRNQFSEPEWMFSMYCAIRDRSQARKILASADAHEAKAKINRLSASDDGASTIATTLLKLAGSSEKIESMSDDLVDVLKESLDRDAIGALFAKLGFDVSG